MTTFYAHSGQRPDHSDWQLLKEHLLRVAVLARTLAGLACPSVAYLTEAAYAAGLLHDLGKYRPEFQLMIRGIQVQKERTYHKQAGAAKAFSTRDYFAAFAIAGHHGGMPDQAKLTDIVRDPISGQAVAQAVWPMAIADCSSLNTLTVQPPPINDFLQGELFTRLVFSCLVDADWTDTGEHARKVKGLPKEPPLPRLDALDWLDRVLSYIHDRATHCAEPKMAQLRGSILNACLVKAELAPGLFSLTVPTGGGKTLSGLAFALKHAAVRSLRRIIYVAPYLSILDQNARVIREALKFEQNGNELFEHHSLSEPVKDDANDESDQAAAVRRAENWDSPVIITTSVQFFESLFANKPGRCRKLHNLAQSVILLDECQTLPPELVAPTCAMLGQLTKHLGCSVVLCTATQPAFNHDELKAHEKLDAHEIIPPELNLFAQLQRVRITWPARDAMLDWAAVASLMRSEKSTQGKKTSALCIVNSKRAARELLKELQDQGAAKVFHLSTSMCPMHRLAVIDRVKALLLNNQRCYLVSTQLIEAGVDIDFPFVLRELAPLEAIIQAAGRCNREGKLNGPDGSPGGRVLVFRSLASQTEPCKYYPADAWYKAGRSVLESSFLNNDRQPQIDDPAVIREYFVRLYRTGNLDAKGIHEHRQRFEFQSVGEKYRLIENDGEAVLVATWAEKAQEIEDLLDDVRRKQSRSAFRNLAPYQVNLRRNQLHEANNWVGEEVPGIFIWRGAYDNHLGLIADNVDTLLIV